MALKDGKNKGPEPKGRITVALVEDNVDFAHTVRDFLAEEADIELLGLSHDEKTFQDSIRKHLPEIALMDLGLSKSDSGVELLKWLAHEYPVVKPVIMTVNENDIRQCYELGARGYILKANLEILAPTIRDVHAGKLIIPLNVGEILVRQMAEQGRKLRQSESLRNLSDREREILALHQNGLDREAISEKLCLSYFTVRRHFQNVLEKTGFSSVKELLEKHGEVLGRT